MVVRLTEADLATHIFCLGASGSGKSRWLLRAILELIAGGQGVGVIDPHGELYTGIVANLPKLGKRVHERLVFIDPLYPTQAVGINPLQLRPKETAERRALFLATVISKIFHSDPLITARMQRLMFHSFWLLILAQLTLVEFVPLLTDKAFRANLLLSIPQTAMLHNYWYKEFPTQARLVIEWTQSSLNRVGSLVTDPDIARILGQQKSSVDCRQIMDEGKVLLVNLPKGILGESNSYLLGAFVLAQIQLAALSRADTPYSPHTHWTIFIDEFQNLLSDDIHTILAETRKYFLSLVMAHQYYEQLRDQPKLQAAVLNTVGNLVVFQTGATDAELLVKDIFTPSLDQVKDTRRRTVYTGLKWFPVIWEEDIVYRPLPEILEQEIRKITSLEKREFWYKRRGNSAPMKLRTLDMPDVKRTPQLEQAIAELTAQVMARYGRSRAQVEQEIAARQERLFSINSGMDFVPPEVTEE